MIKYRTDYGIFYSNKITTVEVERETETSIWIDGRRVSKLEKYWDTWNEAHAHLLREANHKVTQAKYSFEIANDQLDSIKNMTKPE